MTESEIEEMKAMADFIDKDAHNMSLYQRWEMLKKAGERLDQAYATIKRLLEILENYQ